MSTNVFYTISTISLKSLNTNILRFIEFLNNYSIIIFSGLLGLVLLNFFILYMERKTITNSSSSNNLENNPNYNNNDDDNRSNLTDGRDRIDRALGYGSFGTAIFGPIIAALKFIPPLSRIYLTAGFAASFTVFGYSLNSDVEESRVPINRPESPPIDINLNPDGEELYRLLRREIENANGEINYKIVTLSEELVKHIKEGNYASPKIINAVDDLVSKIIKENNTSPEVISAVENLALNIREENNSSPEILISPTSDTSSNPITYPSRENDNSPFSTSSVPASENEENPKYSSDLYEDSDSVTGGNSPKYPLDLYEDSDSVTGGNSPENPFNVPSPNEDDNLFYQILKYLESLKENGYSEIKEFFLNLFPYDGDPTMFYLFNITIILVCILGLLLSALLTFSIKLLKLEEKEYVRNRPLLYKFVISYSKIKDIYLIFSLLSILILLLFVFITINLMWNSYWHYK